MFLHHGVQCNHNVNDIKLQMGKAITKDVQPERLAADSVLEASLCRSDCYRPGERGKSSFCQTVFNRDGVASVNRLLSGGIFPQVGWNRGVLCFIPVYG